jgi:hypothetical protein
LTPKQFIGRAPWRFAKTMPTSRTSTPSAGETPDEEFNWFVLYIRELGHCAKYGDHHYTYREVDAWRYWTMGARWGTTIINAAADRPARSA